MRLNLRFESWSRHMTKKELEAEVERLRNENARLIEALSHPSPVLPPIPVPAVQPGWLPPPPQYPITYDGIC